MGLAREGLRAFVISGNMGVDDAEGCYGLPAAEMEALIADFMRQVRAAQG